MEKYNAGDEITETKKKCSKCETEIVRICKEYNNQKSEGSWKEVGTTVSHYRMIRQGVFECIKSGDSLGKGKSDSSTDARFDAIEKRLAKLEGNSSDF